MIMNTAYKVLLMPAAILLGRQGQGVMSQQKGEESSPLRNLKGKPVKTTTTSSTQVTTTTSTTTTTTTTTKTTTAPPHLVDFMYSKFYDGNFLCTFLFSFFSHLVITHSIIAAYGAPSIGRNPPIANPGNKCSKFAISICY